MNVRIDGDAVYVDAEGWSALATGASEQVDALAGVPGMAQALAATKDPVARLHLDLVAPAGRFTHLAWISYEAVALLRDSPSGERRVLALPPDHLPAALARLVGLGPRRGRLLRVEDLDEERAGTWFGADHEAATADLDQIGADRAWTLTLTAADDRRDPPLVASVIDGPAGPRLLSLLDGRMLAEPVSPTGVWRLLAGLFGALDDGDGSR